MVACPPWCYLQEREKSEETYHYGLPTQRDVDWPGQELANKRERERGATLFPRNGEVSSPSQKALEQAVGNSCVSVHCRLDSSI